MLAAQRPALLLAPAFRRILVTKSPRPLLPGLILPVRSSTTIAAPEFWKSLVPKPLRERQKTGKVKVKKGWNPATYFIWMFLFIGSMSIQMIALKKDHAAFMRRADVRIGQLREVVEKLQNGEEVDVEKVLGTGDAEKEREWEEGRSAQKKKKKKKMRTIKETLC